jgi:glycosyltransferase involved in cell wall biosynthesis
VAGLIKRRVPVFWVADYRDLWYGSSLLTGIWPFSRIEKAIEDTLVRKADLITTVSSPWRDMLRARFGERVVTIENGFDLEDLRGLITESVFPRDGRIRLAYTGTFYPERQDPEPLFRALARLRDRGVRIDQRLEVLFYGVKESALESLVTKYRLQGIVVAKRYTDRKTVLRMQRDADLLLFLDWIDPSFKGMLTGKLYEYLYAGTPVLCIGTSPDTDAARFIVEAGIGLSAGMSEALISTILTKLLLGTPLPYSPSADALARFTRERLSTRMLDEIVKRLSQRTSQASPPPIPS